jgi:hypothetical protein
MHGRFFRGGTTRFHPVRGNKHLLEGARQPTNQQTKQNKTNKKKLVDIEILVRKKGNLYIFRNSAILFDPSEYSKK